MKIELENGGTIEVIPLNEPEQELKGVNPYPPITFEDFQEDDECSLN